MKPEEGLCFIGRIGSGKTTLLRVLLQDLNCPFMWWTTKADEADSVCEMFPDAKRFTGGFNPFTYEMSRQGGDAVSLAQKLTDINEVLTRADKKGEAFWESNFQAALMHACNVIWIARGDDGSLAEVYRFLMSTPESKKEVDTPEFRESICFPSDSESPVDG